MSQASALSAIASTKHSDFIEGFEAEPQAQAQAQAQALTPLDSIDELVRAAKNHLKEELTRSKAKLLENTDAEISWIHSVGQKLYELKNDHKEGEPLPLLEMVITRYFKSLGLVERVGTSDQNGEQVIDEVMKHINHGHSVLILFCVNQEECILVALTPSFSAEGSLESVQFTNTMVGGYTISEHQIVNMLLNIWRNLSSGDSPNRVLAMRRQ